MGKDNKADMTETPHDAAADPQQIIAELQRNLNERTAERDESLTYQTAISNVLNVISRSPSDIQPVLDTIAETAQQLCESEHAYIFRLDGDKYHLVAARDVRAERIAFLKDNPIVPNRGSTVGRVALERRPVHVMDALADNEYKLSLVGHGGRTILGVPLLRDGIAIGVIVLTRGVVRPFVERQIQLVSTFADQALIAIENVRLFDEVQAKTRDLSEALIYQTGSSNILGVIASSPTDVGPVLTAIVDSACDLCDAVDAIVLLKDGNSLWTSAHHGSIPLDMERWPISRKWVAGRAFLDQKPVHVRDLLSADGDEFPETRQRTPRTGTRSILSVPLLSEGKSIGTIVLRRIEVHPFSNKQITLLQTFADQAVIAIGNVRLFDEVQAKTRDLTQALQQQIATADVLKVISRSAFDLQTVLETLVRSAAELTGCKRGVIFLRDGDLFRFKAMSYADANPDWINFLKEHPQKAGQNSAIARAISSGQIAYVPDVLADAQIDMPATALAGIRAVLAVPLLRDGKVEGVMALSRSTPGTFDTRQIDLVQTFADQAVIAIENVRLFDETREALERQTATAEILKVIASSPKDVQPVFDAIAASANRLLGGFSSTVFRFIDGMAHLKAFTPTTPEADEILQASFPRRVADFAPFQMTQAGGVMQIPDTEAPTYELKEIARSRGYRSILYAPLMNKGVSIGFIAVTRVQPSTFADHHVQLLLTFADQAVIAIENARLFDEVQAKTRDLTESLEQQTATSEVLQVISSSPGELEPVFQKMLENATRVCGANFGIMNLWDGERFNIVAGHNVPPAFVAFRKQNAHRSHPEAPLAAVDQTHQFVHVPDMRNNRAYLASDPNVVALVDIAGARTLVIVPMLKEDELIGTISIFRQETRPFTDKQIALVENFTKQAVIAIENTRLLRELRERTTELSLSLEELRTAQDRLVQTEKLASLGQLTAGIAHEIKNPLNFVNNFSALSSELIDEMSEVLKSTNLDDKIREEIDELTHILKSNLEKVVQHGKRADSIVKNMLLHSREGSGEHRPADINSLLDESLNLAYHGARAEKGEFNITLQRDFDVDAGTIELFPQEITRAFLNLIANGVYAATKRKTEDREPDFEPTIRATTKNLGTTVEIRIRDNGIGIPAEVQEKMFNPFFTTKPAGEGTGLGLSMTHDIIVKQHGGRIDVETEPGQFTEFTIVLPRKSNLSGSDRGRT